MSAVQLENACKTWQAKSRLHKIAQQLAEIKAKMKK